MITSSRRLIHKHARSALYAAVAFGATVAVHATPTEAESKARELLNATFLSSGNNWFCAQQVSGQWQLVELRNARSNFRNDAVEETDRLNGVTERFTVYVTCDQYRERRGAWSEWTKGTPGVTGELAVAMTGGLLSYWSGHGEKKNGAWSVRTGIGGHQLSQDRNLVRLLLENPDRVQQVTKSSSTGNGVPALAETKAAAEAGDPEAQYAFAQTFGTGGTDWKRWMSAAAAQGYGAAEDAVAWTMNWAYFANSNPQVIAVHLKNHGAEMRQALLLAGSAADKGFEHSRQLLAMAYGNGVLVQRDPIEAYKWYRLLKDAERNPTRGSPNDELVKTMSLDQVREAEALAASYRSGRTAMQIKDALVISKLKLTGLATNGTERIAVVNNTRLKAGQDVVLAVEGTNVEVHCLSIDSNSVVLSLPADGGRVTLRMGGATVILRPLNPTQ